MTIPEQCQRCYKYHHKSVESSCSLCQNIKFTERILCDITREAQQESEEFECEAFRPNLMVVRPQADGQRDTSVAEQQVAPAHNLLQSEKIKWMLAYAKQQLAMDPDKVIYDLKYHLCLVTRFRKPILQLGNQDLDDLAEAIKESSGFFDGNTYFLSMGVDHMHMYVESTPDETVAEIANHIIAYTATELQEVLGQQAPSAGNMFHHTYFVESIYSSR